MLRLGDREFAAVANRPATFTLYSSTVRHARHGEVVALRDDEATRLAPLVAVLKLGKRNYHAEVPVRVTAEYTEAGALEERPTAVVSAARCRRCAVVVDGLCATANRFCT